MPSQAMSEKELCNSSLVVDRFDDIVSVPASSFQFHSITQYTIYVVYPHTPRHTYGQLLRLK